VPVSPVDEPPLRHLVNPGARDLQELLDLLVELGLGVPLRLREQQVTGD